MVDDENEIDELLRKFETNLTDFFAGGQLDARYLYDARMRLYAHPDFGSISERYSTVISRAYAAGIAAWRLAHPK